MVIQAAAAAAGGLVAFDYTRRLQDSALCNFLRDERERQEGTDAVINIGYGLLCEPYEEEPPPPPNREDIPFGGTNCRLYRVTFESGDSQGNSSVSVADIRGPIRQVKITGSDSQGTFKRFFLQGGTNLGCPFQQIPMAASSNINVIDVYATILSIEPLEGIGQPDISIPQPPGEEPVPPREPFEYNIQVDIGGFEVDVDVNFEPVINNEFGPFIPFTLAPSPRFNLPIDINLNPAPRFGIDLNLDLVVSLSPGGGNANPLPGTDPVPVPREPTPQPSNGGEIDYERIEYIVELAKCCKPVTSTTQITTVTFENDTDVFLVSLPDNCVCVFLGIIPGQNTRVYKTNANSAEFGHGNAAASVEGNVIEFVRLYVNEHVIYYPFEASNKAVRLSLQKGSIVNVTAGLYTPPPPPPDATSN